MEEILYKEKSVDKDIYGKTYNKSLLITVMMIGSFVSILNQTLLSTALPQIMKYFQITASTGQWLTTAFMLINAIMIPLTALLLEKIPTKKLFIFSVAMFGIGTVLCAIQTAFDGRSNAQPSCFCFRDIYINHGDRKHFKYSISGSWYFNTYFSSEHSWSISI